MDTRRIILFVIFSFSVLFLWQAWQQEHMPPPPKPAASAPAAAPGAAPPPKDVPVPSVAAAAPGAVPGTPPTAAPTGAPTVPPITIRTDLYTAEVDPIGGDIALVSLARHRHATDTTKPDRALQPTS